MAYFPSTYCRAHDGFSEHQDSPSTASVDSAMQGLKGVGSKLSKATQYVADKAKSTASDTPKSSSGKTKFSPPCLLAAYSVFSRSSKHPSAVFCTLTYTVFNSSQMKARALVESSMWLAYVGDEDQECLIKQIVKRVSSTVLWAGAHVSEHWDVGVIADWTVLTLLRYHKSHHVML